MLCAFFTTPQTTKTIVVFIVFRRRDFQTNKRLIGRIQDPTFSTQLHSKLTSQLKKKYNFSEQINTNPPGAFVQPDISKQRPAAAALA